VKYLIVTVLLNLSFVASASDSLWVNKQNDKTMSLWAAKKNEKIMVARHQFSPSSKIKRKMGDKMELFKSVENEKRTLLSWVGIKNWTPTEYDWKPSTEGGLLTIKGHYQDSKGQLVGFIEKHKYGASTEKAIQDVFTQPISDPKSELDAELMKSFLSGGFN
jgi:hypothetical protein